MNPKYIVLGFFGLGLAVLIGRQFMPAAQMPHMMQTTSGETGAPLADVKVPELSAAAKAGKALFDANCAACHGANAAGQDGIAPPLVHPIYRPGHHGDASFVLAAKNGAQAHHWPFGNMPPVDGVTEDEVLQIVTYVRELQRANGIQ